MCRRKSQRTARPDVSPSEVPGFSRPAAFPSPGRSSLSWRRLPCRVLFVASYRACWVDPIPPMPRRFRRTVMVFRRCRPPAPCETGFILSCALSAFRVPSRVGLSARLSTANASLGVSSLFTTSTRGVHLPPGVPHPTMFRPQRFARSRRFAPPRALRACFIALPRPGFSLQGFPPTIRPYRISATVTLAPLAPPPAGCPAPANVASTSGSCSEPWSAVSGEVFTLDRHPYPLLRFQLPRVSAR
jgi:hypothetical protein